MCAFGKAARSAIGNQDMSIEAAVVGIVDRVELQESVSEEMRDAARELIRDNGRPSRCRLPIANCQLKDSSLKLVRTQRISAIRESMAIKPVSTNNRRIGNSAIAKRQCN